MRISDWSSDVCSSDLTGRRDFRRAARKAADRGAREAGHRHHLHGQPALDGICQRQPRNARGRASVRRAVLLQLSLRRRSEEHTSELQSLMRISYAVFCLKKKKTTKKLTTHRTTKTTHEIHI